MFFKRIIMRIIANAGALYFTDHFLDTMKVEGGVEAFAILALIFTVANMILKPLIKILSFPLMILTGGLFSIVINAFILFISTINLARFSPDMKVTISSIQTYFIASILIAIITWVEWIFLKPRKKKRDDDHNDED
jgi:putative membrane protein